MAEHPERIESAVVSYLQGLPPGTWNQTILDDTTGNIRIFSGESEQDKTGQCIICRVDGNMGDEDPPFSNNRWCDFVIELHTPIIQEDINQDWMDAHKSNATAIEGAILVDTFESSISNSGLLCYKAINRQPIREQTENYWVSGYRFRLYSALLN